MALLAARDLSVVMRGAGATVLKDLSFTLQPGRILGLVGESGAGKSMIGRVIASDLPAGFAVAGGSLSFDGQDLLAQTPRARRALLGRDIAFIPQEPMAALNPVRSIGAQFGEHLRRLGVAGRTARRDRMVEMFAAVELRDGAALLDRYPHQLSGGMCQRVLIAMAFAGAPKLVVADEPTTALDVTVQARILELLAGLQARHGTGVVFITHDLRLAGQICDEVLVLYAGRPVEQGPARDVLRAPRHPYTRCLLLANPPMHGPRRALLTLPDQMPGVLSLPSLRGCRFAPRCPLAQPDCATIEPSLTDGCACLYAGLTPRIGPPVLPPSAPRRRADAAPILEVKDLAKHFAAPRVLFRRGPGTTAVQPADFQVAQGEFLGIVGESGSGKSTIARLVVGLETPTAGRIILGGVDVTAGNAAAHRRHMAQMVFQNPQSALNPRRRVGRIVTQAMEVERDATQDRAARATELLASVGMAAEMAARYPFQLSGGQRQRVNIARALCVLPRLLVADEIVSGLDVSVQAQIIALLQKLRAEMDFAMLFISHDLSVVRHLCDRVLVMHRGHIVERGETAEIFARPRHAYTQQLLAAVPAGAEELV